MRILLLLRLLGLKKIICLFVSINKHGYNLMALLMAAKGSSNYLEDDYIQVSYSGLYHESIKLMSHLENNYSIKSKSKVIISSSNSLGFIKSLFAVSGLGADIYLLNPNHKFDYIASFVSKKNIDLIIGNAATLSDFALLAIPTFDYESALDKQDSPIKIKRRTCSIVILSSGSKGIPKEEKRKATVLNYLNPLTEMVSKLELLHNQSVLISVPLFHGYGLAALLLSVFMKQSIRVTHKFDSAKTTQILKQRA